MAPVAPKMSHRAKALARIADPTLPRKVHRDNNAVTDAFLHSKRDKQLIRKASFRARITDKLSEQGRGGGGKPLKRRRPSKKLITTLESLADALPEVGDAGSGGEGSSAAKKARRQGSIRTRPGSLKRKEKVVQAEMARFGLNLVQLTAVKEDVVVETMDTEGGTDDKADDSSKAPAPPAPAVAKQSTANRFALLRNYITATMDQSPAFAKK